jgi:predicted nucleic acid-binding protein
MKVYFDANVLGYACLKQGNPKAMEMARASLFLLRAVRQDRVEGVMSMATVAEIDRMEDSELKEETFKTMREHRVNLISPERKLEVEHLAQMYRTLGAFVSRKALVDSVHLAWATVAGVDVLVSWNRRHLVRWKTRAMAAIINVRFGYRPVDIQTPLEVLREAQ